MNILDAVFLGALQGVTEFLPISSSGHLILFRDIFHIQLTQGLAFDAILQLGSMVAILIYFWKDLSQIVKALIQKYIYRSKTTHYHAQLGESIIIASLPILIIGFLGEKFIEAHLRTGIIVASMFILFALVFFHAESRYTRIQKKEHASFTDIFFLGCAQVLALVPGVSRSGITLVGGIYKGLTRIEAARISFLLSVPAITLSGLKKLYDILKEPQQLAGISTQVSIGFIVSACVSLIAIAFLMKFLRKHTLKPFAWYRILVGAILLMSFIRF